MKRDSSLLVAGVLLTLAAVPLACAEAVTVEDQGGAGTTGAGGSTGVGGTTTATGTGTGGSGPCTGADDCSAFTDACNTGTCINGGCEKVPSSDGALCDDGKQCSTGDQCVAGECTGTLKPCPSGGPCTVGMCDLDTDACIEVPGNDGASCVDDDPCTLTGICSNGTCGPGQPVDCSFLNGTCSVGMCDPGLGCVAMPLNDGAACDDGFYCTINDVCTAGVCGGVPNTCAAPGDVCLIGTCNENTDSCVAVPGNNGGACNDNSTCTAGETCNAGVCGGGAPANQGGACDDKNACTSGDSCANGACVGAPVVACQNGDGCCPPGCDLASDDDCSGVVYMTSSNGTPGFYAYDVNTNVWSIKPNPPAVTYSQITTDGTHVLLLGQDNVIYSFDPGTNVWSQGPQGPGFEASTPIGFFKWTPSGYYYVKDGGPGLKHQVGNSWVTINLPLAASCAGTFDPQSGNLYIRGYATFDVIVFSTATNTVAQTWPNPSSVGENSRTGSFFGGYFYEREWSGPFYKVSMANGVATQTAITPVEGHTATDVDLSSGQIFIAPYEPTGTVFQVFNASTNVLQTLAPAPVALTNHSTIVLVK